MRHEHSQLNGDDESKRTSSRAAIARRDFVLSMYILAFVITLALCRVALDANWIKCVRVSLAFCVYALVVLTLLRVFVRAGVAASLPFWPFALAAALAELASGWLRPGMHLNTTLESALAAALLIGGVHWLSLHYWQTLRDKIEGGLRSNARQAT